jgi:glycosyltransferase involved in cell wall biosynthesis
MTLSCVVILDPRGVILSGGADVIERHKAYALQLAKHNPKNKISLVILTAGTSPIKIQPSSGLYLEVISKPTFNSIKFAKSALEKIRSKNLDVKLLVAGDPWESFWSAHLLNKLSSNKVPIQIQLHGDIADPAWRRISLRNRIRFNIARFSIRKSSGVRAVSNNQALKVARAFKINQTKISEIPVPILNLRRALESAPNRPKTIGLVGRIHNDRGIFNFIKLIKSLSMVRGDFAVLVAGSGPEEARFLKEIKELLPKSKVRFLGQLSENELKKVWKNVGVLLSTAPAESYGRVMREALVAGVPVWATKSSGVEDLISKAGKEAVKLLDLTKSSYELSVEFDQLIKAKVPLRFRKQFIKDNSTYARLLARSWVDLINKQKQ